jgi:hypothetical protein
MKCTVRDCDLELKITHVDGRTGFGLNDAHFTDAPMYGSALCPKHYQQWQNMRRDLPLAIQELSAFATLWSLVSPAERQNGACQMYETARIKAGLDAALDRVGELREQESRLKGEMGGSC